MNTYSNYIVFVGLYFNSMDPLNEYNFKLYSVKGIKIS